eukprot:gnl/MRDRNA2_/MRDRNA2_117925_c0_seq1.p1 gnl/MRDRNA2_/MRDRNA2_117925_c0~~gnl/MRDRNA2_/MRDRNA2_117925_c0_seq1.p1  ORF type:complete len:459 (+),score=120.61 gnl/MRDRNA2_/MRDRNA2_117925_c0_seq1:45-1421(+)
MAAHIGRLSFSAEHGDSDQRNLTLVEKIGQHQKDLAGLESALGQYQAALGKARQFKSQNRGAWVASWEERPSIQERYAWLCNPQADEDEPAAGIEFPARRPQHSQKSRKASDVSLAKRISQSKEEAAETPEVTVPSASHVAQSAPQPEISTGAPEPQVKASESEEKATTETSAPSEASMAERKNSTANEPPAVVVHQPTQPPTAGEVKTVQAQPVATPVATHTQASSDAAPVFQPRLSISGPVWVQLDTVFGLSEGTDHYATVRWQGVIEHQRTKAAPAIPSGGDDPTHKYVIRQQLRLTGGAGGADTRKVEIGVFQGSGENDVEGKAIGLLLLDAADVSLKTIRPHELLDPVSKKASSASLSVSIQAPNAHRASAEGSAALGAGVLAAAGGAATVAAVAEEQQDDGVVDSADDQADDDNQSAGDDDEGGGGGEGENGEEEALEKDEIVDDEDLEEEE